MLLVVSHIEANR